ncbi:MAG: hypothetical protein ACFB11_19445 [Paracoccaceae bacterium]
MSPSLGGAASVKVGLSADIRRFWSDGWCQHYLTETLRALESQKYQTISY